MTDRPKEAETAEVPRRVPLYPLHVELGAKLVAFAGYELPLRYPAGIIAEHRHTRAKASLFDVSHMGQVVLPHVQAGALLERLVPAELVELPSGRMRYTMLTNERGGVLDDLIVGHLRDRWMLVVNAARKAEDVAHLKAELSGACRVEELADRALLALQGPAAEAVLARFAEGCRDLSFMAVAPLIVAGVDAIVSRSGYTGEDGFEISVAALDAEPLARELLSQPEVEPAGLGARDSLRLEAGLCLYGHDLDTTTTPIEAGLAWTIGRRRRKEGGFPGAEVIRHQLEEGPKRKRVGLRPEGAAPAREDTEVRDERGERIGRVTSGGFGPTVNGPIAMGYVAAERAKPGTRVILMIRGAARPAKVVSLPFVEPHYRRA